MPTPLYQELHSSFTNIPCFSPKQNKVLAKMLREERLQKYLEEYAWYTVQFINVLLFAHIASKNNKVLG